MVHFILPVFKDQWIIEIILLSLPQESLPSAGGVRKTLFLFSLSSPSSSSAFCQKECFHSSRHSQSWEISDSKKNCWWIKNQTIKLCPSVWTQPRHAKHFYTHNNLDSTICDKNKETTFYFQSCKNLKIMCKILFKSIVFCL